MTAAQENQDKNCDKLVERYSSRTVTQGLMQDIRALKKSLDDGFNVGGVVARIATQLKNKFLEFDDMGSILAGGVVVNGKVASGTASVTTKLANMSADEVERITISVQEQAKAEEIQMPTEAVVAASKPNLPNSNRTKALPKSPKVTFRRGRIKFSVRL